MEVVEKIGIVWLGVSSVYFTQKFWTLTIETQNAYVTFSLFPIFQSSVWPKVP